MQQNIVQKYIDFAMGNEYNKSNIYSIDKYWTDIFADLSQTIRERKIFSYQFKNIYECTWEKEDPLPFAASIAFASNCIKDLAIYYQSKDNMIGIYTGFKRMLDSGFL